MGQVREWFSGELLSCDVYLEATGRGDHEAPPRPELARHLLGRLLSGRVVVQVEEDALEAL
jgi:hypothetical protein